MSGAHWGDDQNTQGVPSVINVSATVDPAWPLVPFYVGACWESDEGNNTRVRDLKLQSNGYQYIEK